MKIALSIILLPLFHFSLSAQSIFRTACQGNLARLDSMLHHASIDTKDFRGRSLLQWAVACKEKEVFDFLIEKGINVNSEDNQGRTAMYVAVQFNNETYFDFLLEAQPNKDWIDKYGAMLLERAVLNENNLFVSKLIESGIDVNARNSKGSTALEVSMRIGAEKISELLLSLGADKNLLRTFEMKGEYLGQEVPGIEPKVFAPNFISTEEFEFGSVFNNNETEFYYGVDVASRNNEIRCSKLDGNKWSEPQTILSHEKYGYNDPFLSPDEKRLYFISNRPLDGTGDPKEDIDIWYVERTDAGWSDPINAGPNINSTGNEYYISFTNNGTMYFSSSVNSPKEEPNQDIYYSEFKDGAFQKAISLGDSINTPGYEADVFVAPDESYLIFCSTRAGGVGRGDLYISFKKEDGTWTSSINMGEPINTVNHELCPFVTTDGKYLFYTSNEDIFWVSTAILNQYKTDKN